MNPASVESIKLNFDLANFTENELQEKIDSLNPDIDNSFINLLTKLDGFLTIYKAIGKDIEAQQLQFSNIIELIDSLNNSPSLKLFNYLFGYYENKIFLPTATISLNNLINVLNVIDKFQPSPRLPWPKVNGFLLFNEDTENKLLEPGNHSISQDQFYGRVNVFNSEEDIVIGNLQMPDYNNRKNDIFKLFINFKIAKCINKTPTVEYLNLKTQEILKKDKNWKIKNEDSEIDLDEYVTHLFKKVYLDTEKDVKQKNLVPKNIDIESDKWDELLRHASLVKDNLILLQKKHKNILDHFEVKDGVAKELLTRNKLLSEVREFLNTNKIKKEWASLNIDERFLPDRNVIEAIPGGKGLMKRISLLEGGVISFKRIYPVWIAQKIQKESSNAEVDDKFNRYDNRYDATQLNAKDMTIKNSSEIGNIYVLSNKTMPNIFKIGVTRKNPAERTRQIGTILDVNSGFDLEKYWITKNPLEVERNILVALAKYREDCPGFITCDLKQIFSTVENYIQKID